MAKFSQEFLRQAASPMGSVQGGLLSAVGGAATLPQQLQKEQQRQTEINEMSKYTPGTPEYDAARAKILQAKGMFTEAGATGAAAIQAQQAASERERTREAIKSLTPIALKKAARSPNPATSDALVRSMVKTLDLDGLREFLKPKETDIDAGFTITEWVNDDGVVVEKTIQDKSGKTRRVGDRSLVTTQDLSDLKIRTTPKTTVSVSSAQETQLAKDLGGGLAAEVIKANELATEAESNLSLIAEARIVASENPEVFGAGANTLDAIRRGTQTTMRLLGVPETDPVFSKIAKSTESTDIINAFTQDFVRSRLAATKGAISNKEFETFIASVPNLLSTPGGYQKLLTYMEAANTRQILRTASLNKAGTSAEKIQQAKTKWTSFTRDFPATSFIPSDDVEKMWRLYESGKGKKENMTFVTNIIGPDGNPTGEKRTLTYKQIQDMSKKATEPLAPMLLLRRLYLQENSDTRFVMPN